MQATCTARILDFAADLGFRQQAGVGKVRERLRQTGVSCCASGAGGLSSGYLGAWLQPRLPDRALRLLLAGGAIILTCLYLVQGLG
jgi:hypothetical protein